MIFLSHTHADKPLVDQIAKQLAAAFGQGAVFYDSWAIQPGDGIIDRMNAGLDNCKVFFFFVSKKSLQSNMVKLEWQNALLKATRGETRIVPVKIDDVLMPAVLLQTLYVDIFGQGLENGIRQMVDVASGRNTYTSSPEQTFENVRGYLSSAPGKLVIEFRAEAYMEPHSRYLILLGNSESEVTFSAPGEGYFESGFQKDVRLNDGRTYSGILIARSTATSPGFPLIAEVVTKDGSLVKFEGAMRIVARDQWRSIPIIVSQAS